MITLIKIAPALAIIIFLYKASILKNKICFLGDVCIKNLSHIADIQIFFKKTKNYITVEVKMLKMDKDAI